MVLSAWWPAAVLAVLVAAVLLAEQRPAAQPLFRWLPVPLWCYVLPAAAVTVGLLPSGHPAYRTLTDFLLPFALSCLLLGVDLPAVARVGRRALLAAAVGASGIVIGASLCIRLLQPHLPAEAWKGAGALAGTWTGGSMNLLALRAVLRIPDAIFAPLILVDALIAYSWMALLVAAAGIQGPFNRWLRASEHPGHAAPQAPSSAPQHTGRDALIVCALAAGLVWSTRLAAIYLPTTLLISSVSGWIALLVTTGALLCSLIPALRRAGSAGGRLGYPCLYLVLAATGAQSHVGALWSSPVWLAAGIGIALVHGGVLLLAGRAWRIPLGTLATASQANIGGIVSAPMVGAVYDRSLVPVGLLLAMAGNALGTYFGLLAATLCRWLAGGT